MANDLGQMDRDIKAVQAEVSHSQKSRLTFVSDENILGTSGEGPIT